MPSYVCEASSIVCDDAAVSWFGPAGATWRAPLGRLRVIGELTLGGADRSWFLAFVVDDAGGWLQAPGTANGMSLVLERLAIVLDAQLEPKLSDQPPGRSRVMWPLALLDSELLAGPASGTAPGTAGMSLHPAVLEFIRSA